MKNVGDVFWDSVYSAGGATKRRGTQGNLPPTLPLDGPRCINNALINALKINAVR